MAKKNYQKLESIWTPRVESNGTDNVFFEFLCENSKGTQVKVSIMMDTFYLPEMIKSFSQIAKRKVSHAIEFQNRIKDAVL